MNRSWYLERGKCFFRRLLLPCKLLGQLELAPWHNPYTGMAHTVWVVKKRKKVKTYSWLKLMLSDIQVLILFTKQYQNLYVTEHQYMTKVHLRDGILCNPASIVCQLFFGFRVKHYHGSTEQAANPLIQNPDETLTEHGIHVDENGIYVEGPALRHLLRWRTIPTVLSTVQTLLSNDEGSGTDEGSVTNTPTAYVVWQEGLNAQVRPLLPSDIRQ